MRMKGEEVDKCRHSGERRSGEVAVGGKGTNGRFLKRW